ncbi:hypothetical protein [Cryobacterium sp. TMT2-42-4]|uniref:hypothetical protein n=1 Tax=Cryobacterium sp. TMT2-42-4 TaxID=1259255 RepID=UPI0018E099F2|nr:hypothetical protein [Cryobacterium sp. TMT2-42-4]
MDELGIDVAQSKAWFPTIEKTGYTFVEVTDEQARLWSDTLGLPIRRCYISDAVLAQRGAIHGSSRTDVLNAKTPPRGSTMAGDFGEIIVALFQAAEFSPGSLLEPKKWRLKHDRTKPASHSDIVQFVVPTWPVASDEDWILCAEVKTKSTAGQTEPIVAAIEDSTKDRLSRLSKTLPWLRERALVEDLGTVTVAHLDRFINLTEHPPAGRRFRAVAVISEEMVQTELITLPSDIPVECGVVVISVPRLKEVYESVFESVERAADTAP